MADWWRRALGMRRRLVTWLLLACASVWLAEVSATSSRFPLVSWQGWALLVPLYGLHVLLAGWLATRARRITWPLLYLPGMLVGLYEAYLTKVLWDPTWSKDSWHWQLGGVYVVQTAVLVLFWHPLLAFVLPLVLVERTCTDSTEVFEALPRPLRWLVGTRLGLVVLGVLTGVYSSLNASLVVALGSAATTVVVVLVVRRVAVSRGPVGSLRALLPTNRQALWLAAMLVAGYLVLGAGMRPSSLPAFVPGQLTVWALYAVVVVLYVGALRRARALTVLLPGTRAPGRSVRLLGVVFTAAAGAGALLPAVARDVSLAVLVVGTASGLVWLVQEVWASCRQRRAVSRG